MNWLKEKIITFILKKVLKGVFTMKVKKFLEGKKTYLTCASTILGIVIAWVTGEVDLAEMATVVAIALIGITLRAGESKIEKKIDAVKKP